MIKSILGGKSKNLFDISKVITSNVVKRNGNSLICSSYGTSIGTLGSICPTLKPSDLITISFKCASEGVPSKFMAFGGRTFYSGATFLVSDIGLSTPWYLYSTDYAHSGIPNETTYSDIQIELGSTATEYVPHELTSYKSIMKVSDGHFVTSFDERMPCKTKNLFSSSTEVGIPSSTKFGKSEKRLLEDGKWYIGLAGSNYYSRGEILDYSIIENSVYIKWKGNGYGVAKCIYCEPSTTYSFTMKYNLIQGHSLGISVGFYTEDGTFISFKGGTATPHFVFTTPENCKYIAICIVGTKFPNDNFGAGCFSDLQLVKGTTATDYVPYGYV